MCTAGAALIILEAPPEGQDGAMDVEKEETGWVMKATETGKSVRTLRPLVWKMKGMRTQLLPQHDWGDETIWAGK